MNIYVDCLANFYFMYFGCTAQNKMASGATNLRIGVSIDWFHEYLFHLSVYLARDDFLVLSLLISSLLPGFLFSNLQACSSTPSLIIFHSPPDCIPRLV